MSTHENIAIPCDVIPPDARWADGREHHDDAGTGVDVEPGACTTAASRSPVRPEDVAAACLRGHP